VNDFTLIPIGHVQSPLTAREAAPKQADGAPSAWLVFEADVREGLADLRVGDAVVVLTWLHRAARDTLVVHPRDDPSAPLTGVFATRSGDRPNPVGVHPSRIIAIDGQRVQVDQLEAIDGTPVIDVKSELPLEAPPGSNAVNAVAWGDFAAAAPALAEFGATRLLSAPSYLATARVDGAPRVHPVTPIIGDGRLFIFMEPTSPKGRDLRERATFALHNGVPDTAGTGGEFAMSGRAALVTDADTRVAAERAASYEPADRYILFELLVSEARCNGYGDVALPTVRHWRASAAA
jgi:tRNA-Thr(GGU) m(6)t(6)A37 methyltransferase TsaA